MNEETLREVLVKLIAYAKDDHQYAVMLGNELAALRDALDELMEDLRPAPPDLDCSHRRGYRRLLVMALRA